MKPFLRTKGKWIHIVYFNKGSTKPIEKSLHISNTKRGMLEAKSKLPEYENKSVVDYSNRTKLSEMYKIYKSQCELKEGTYDLREIAINHFIDACGDKTLKDVNEKDGVKYKEYLDEKFKSVNTRAIYSSELKAFFNDLIEAKKLSINPVILIKRKVKKVETIPDDDFEKILDYLKSKNWEWYSLISFLKYTGMRKIDALSLTWDCIRFEDNIIDTESIKTDYSYQIPLTKPIRELLDRAESRTGIIFNRHKKLNFWDRSQSKLELKRHYTIHEIRKTFISKLLQSGIPITMVAKLVGHKRVNTTYTYYTKFETQQLGKELDMVWENLGKSNGNFNGNPDLLNSNDNNNNNL